MKFSLSVLSQYILKNIIEQNYIQGQNISPFSSIFRIPFTFEINSVTSVEDLVTNVTEESDHRTLGSKKYSV